MRRFCRSKRLNNEQALSPAQSQQQQKQQKQRLKLPGAGGGGSERPSAASPRPTSSKISAAATEVDACYRRFISSSSSSQWYGLKPSVLGQDRSENKKKSVLVLILVLQVRCCVVKHGLVTLVVIMILKDTTTFQVLFIVSLFCAWNITTVEINSDVHLLKS